VSPDGSQIAFLMTTPSDVTRQATREKRDAFVVNENHKRSRLYVLPVAAGGDGKRAVSPADGGDLPWAACSADVTFRLFSGWRRELSSPSPRLWSLLQKTRLVGCRIRDGPRDRPSLRGEAAETQPIFSPTDG